MSHVILARGGGAPTTLHSFDSADGAELQASLIQTPDGNLYGTTSRGGKNSTNCGSDGYICGTVFKITTRGALTTLYSFCSEPKCMDGAYPLVL